MNREADLQQLRRATAAISCYLAQTCSDPLRVSPREVQELLDVGDLLLRMSPGLQDLRENAKSSPEVAEELLKYQESLIRIRGRMEGMLVAALNCHDVLNDKRLHLNAVLAWYCVYQLNQ